MKSNNAVSRRHFLQGTVAAAAVVGVSEGYSAEQSDAPVYQATGIRIGEVTPSSAMIWDAADQALGTQQ